MKCLRLICLGVSYLCNTYHWWTLQKNRWDKGDMTQKLCMIWHGITSLKTWILQIQTCTEKIKLIGYLILGEIKFCNLKNEHFVRNVFFFAKQHFIFFVIKHEPFEVKRSMRLFKNKQKWLDKIVCFKFLRN